MPARAEEWTDYWSRGHRHSCPTTFDGFYGEATQAHWRRVAGQFQSGAVCVDMCSGPGELLKFLSGCLDEGVSVEFIGVDAAELNVESNPHPSNLTLLDRTDATDTGLAASSVTDLVSQFGVEYVPEAGLIEEIDRICASKARLAFVMHHAASQIVNVGRDELALCSAAVEDSGVLALSRQMIPFLEAARTPAGRSALSANAAAARIRQQYNKAVETFVRLSDSMEHGSFAHDVMSSITSAFSQVQSGSLAGSQATKALSGLDDELTAHHRRLQAMLDTARSRQSIEQFRTRFEAKGFRIRIGELREQGYLMAWTLHGDRP